MLLWRSPSVARLGLLPSAQRSFTARPGQGRVRSLDRYFYPLYPDTVLPKSKPRPRDACTFVKSGSKADNFPPATNEVAFVGRSNVGKSTLLNALFKNKKLAVVSSTPGRTQLVNFFRVGKPELSIVDLPGYGFAYAPGRVVDGMNLMIGEYLRVRRSDNVLKRTFLLVDSRRGIGELDEQFMDFLEAGPVPYQVVLTKVDKLSHSDLLNVIADTSVKLTQRRHEQLEAFLENFTHDLKTPTNDPEELERCDSEEREWLSELSDLSDQEIDLSSSSSSLPHENLLERLSEQGLHDGEELVFPTDHIKFGHLSSPLHDEASSFGGDLAKERRERIMRSSDWQSEESGLSEVKAELVAAATREFVPSCSPFITVVSSRRALGLDELWSVIRDVTKADQMKPR